MSVNSRSPLRMQGAVNLSGQVNDGSVQLTYGGCDTFTAYSGGLITLGSGTAGQLVSNPGTGHAVILSGPGRINSVFVHAGPVAITTSLAFYDANVAAVSGVAGYAASGWTVVGIVPGLALPNISASGVGTAGSLFNPLTVIGMPFFNGLAVSAASGAPGFTVSFSPSNESTPPTV